MTGVLLRSQGSRFGERVFFCADGHRHWVMDAEWLAQHLKRLGYDYFHLDLGYAYARGEYATPNEAQFPQGLLPLSRDGRLTEIVISTARVVR